MALSNAGSKHRTSQGLTLNELLIAMALGLFLVAGIMTVFVQNKRSYVQDDELARMQENARYALRLISRELNLAGLSGYYRFAAHTVEGTPTISGDCGTNWAVKLDQPVDFSNDVTTTPYASCIDAADVETGTDVLVVRRTADDYTLDDGNLNSKAALDPAATDADRIYLAKYGLDYKFVKGSEVTGADMTSGSGVGLWEYYVKVFYIRPYAVSTGDGIPTLCVEGLKLSSMSSACLVEGVENLQLEFGVDGNGDGVADQFKATPSASELRDAVAVRVYLLMRSIGPIAGYTNDKKYTLGSTLVNYVPNDRFFRRVYSTTILLRNIDDV